MRVVDDHRAIIVEQAGGAWPAPCDEVQLHIAAAPQPRRVDVLHGDRPPHVLDARFDDQVERLQSLFGARRAVARAKIGRASCRETGCQYGEIMECAVSLQKKKYKE